ncbi:MAG: alpha/beta hydrolase fold domain-containing protein [Erythrobacter sp.]
MKRLILILSVILLPAAASAQVDLPPWSPELSQAARDALEANSQRAPAPDTMEGRKERAEAIQQEIGQPRLARWNVTMDDTEIAGVPVRILHRSGEQVDWRRPGPILMNLHGGGFMVDSGSITENVEIAAQTGFPVIAVRYRLLPAHPFPAAVEDSLAVYRALLETHGADSIALYGTSAGAILASELTARIKREGIPLPAALGFFSGSADLATQADSLDLFADRSGAEALSRIYAGTTALDDPALSPARGELDGWPQTMCVTSGRDFLLGSTASFCNALQRAGVPVQLWLYDGLPHAFWSYIDAPETDRAFADMATFMTDALGGAAAPERASTTVPAFTMPASNQLSAQALVVLDRMEAARAPAEVSGDLPRQRAFYRQWNDNRLAEMRQHFATRETRTTLGGVPVEIVEPVGEISARNRRRVLINVHGGAFLWGDGSGALVEAVPVASTMGIKVVTVDYRLAPDNRYPAASEDVAAVYKALLEDYPAENIGIYGCSAGGIITAQATAWLRAQDLPRPGAIGTFCGTGAPYSGDSPYVSAAIGDGKPLTLPRLPDVLPTIYMDGVAASDSAAYPLNSQEEIAAMPPTLLLAGGRDFAASTLTLAHRKLAAAGVESELYLFDGLPHAFFMWPDMPESAEAFHLIARFFDRHLGR